MTGEVVKTEEEGEVSGAQAGVLGTEEAVLVKRGAVSVVEGVDLEGVLLVQVVVEDLVTDVALVIDVVHSEVVDLAEEVVCL